jgi:glycosyltransferase involved in cell wall biosynthesis
MRDNGMDGDRIVSIPTGVDTETFDPTRWDRQPFRCEIGVDDDTFVWGMIAMIRRMKGHTVLAEAASILLRERPNLRFVVVGEVPTESPVRTEFETKLEELQLGDKFVMTGYREDVPQIMAGCDATVLPSLFSEGVPQSITQALSMAKPVVATSVGSTPEIVRDSETGLLVPPNDAEALATAMRRIMDDVITAQEMGRKGRVLIEKNYSLQAMTDQVEQVYERLLAEK